jgi:hypothetical protein
MDIERISNSLILGLLLIGLFLWRRRELVTRGETP